MREGWLRDHPGKTVDEYEIAGSCSDTAEGERGAKRPVRRSAEREGGSVPTADSQSSLILARARRATYHRTAPCADPVAPLPTLRSLEMAGGCATLAVNADATRWKALTHPTSGTTTTIVLMWVAIARRAFEDRGCILERTDDGGSALQVLRAGRQGHDSQREHRRSHNQRKFSHQVLYPVCLVAIGETHDDDIVTLRMAPDFCRPAQPLFGERSVNPTPQQGFS
jgi:hypothetical protein